jgi:bacterioferritin
MHEKSIELLNKAVADEMSAVHQYMYFHFHSEDQDYELLSGLFMRTAIEEMEHIELCAERILFLGGEVEMVAAHPVEKIHDVKEMLNKAADMERGSAKDYNLWANECSANADAATRKIFESLVDDEERHLDQYENEMENIKKFGDQYLALQSIEASKGRAAGAEAE